jgi:hypothetical protein
MLPATGRSSRSSAIALTACRKPSAGDAAILSGLRADRSARGATRAGVVCACGSRVTGRCDPRFTGGCGFRVTRRCGFRVTGRCDSRVTGGCDFRVTGGCWFRFGGHSAIARTACLEPGAGDAPIVPGLRTACGCGFRFAGRCDYRIAGRFRPSLAERCRAWRTGCERRSHSGDARERFASHHRAGSARAGGHRV